MNIPAWFCSTFSTGLSLFNSSNWIITLFSLYCWVQENRWAFPSPADVFPIFLNPHMFLLQKKKSSSGKNEPLIRLQPKTDLKILLTERDLSISDLQAACHGKSSNTFKHQICPIRNVICSVRDISISPLNWYQIWCWLKSNFFHAKH